MIEIEYYSSEELENIIGKIEGATEASSIRRGVIKGSAFPV